MKITIDNQDGRGAVDYSASLVAGRPFRILRSLNEPVTCTVTLFPSQSLAMPARNGRVVVNDDSGVLLFTGYVATEPALELAGRGTTGALYQCQVEAVSDDILLSRQTLPQGSAAYAVTAGQALAMFLSQLQKGSITSTLANATQMIGEFRTDAGQTWAANTAALANATRNSWRLMNGTLTLLPVGSVTHTLSESAGTLSVSRLAMTKMRALANDVTVCGREEPSAYVTEYFEGDGTTLLFELTQEPWTPSAALRKPLVDVFQGPAINSQLWVADDPGAALTLTSAGLTCGGGGGNLGATMLSAVSNLEMGGSLVLELANVQFGAQTSGILNGCYIGGATDAAACLLGFRIEQPAGPTTISPLVNGAVAGSSFTPAAGHSYTLRLRYYANEMQRVLQAYYAVGTDNATQLFGANYISTAAQAVFEVQDTSNGIAGAPVVLYSGTLANPAPACLFAPLNAGYLQCSIGSVTVEQMGPQWVMSTPPGGTATVRRLGTAAQGADCTVERTGRLKFYATSTPQLGETIAVSYRTSRRSVARLASSTSIASESAGGTLPGTACWLGSVTSPPPRSSADCGNAAAAMLALATSRAAAWSGQYTAWNLDQQGDVWPGDVLAIAAASAGLTANVVVRTVEIDLTSSSPALAQYTIAFANDWADSLALKTSTSVPADVWLPLQPEANPPLASLNSLAVTALTGSQIQVAAGVTAPTGGGFEVRRRDWSFTAGAGPDLVLRAPVPNFTIPRETATEQYYIRMYDGASPPNYSRFSAAVFVNLPL